MSAIDLSITWPKDSSCIISNLRPAARQDLAEHILMHQGAKPLFRTTVFHLIDRRLDFDVIRGSSPLNGYQLFFVRRPRSPQRAGVVP